MALKAGYNGIKKSVLDKLLQMSGALIIKSLGTALSLSDAGELTVSAASDTAPGIVQPDGETTFIEEGLLKAAASGFSAERIYYNNGSPAPYDTESSLDGSYKFSDFDVLVIGFGQEGDGGISTWTSQRFILLDDDVFKTVGRISFGDYGNRSMSFYPLTDTSFKYTSVSASESSTYRPLVYYLIGIKF